MRRQSYFQHVEVWRSGCAEPNYYKGKIWVRYHEGWIEINCDDNCDIIPANRVFSIRAQGLMLDDDPAE